MASVCRKNNEKFVNYVSNSDSSSDDTDNNIFDYSIFSIKNNSDRGVYTLPVTIDVTKFTLACDTGALCTLVPARFYEENIKKPLRVCRKPYVNYDGQRISLIGEFDANITFEGITKTLTIVVSNSKSPPLLGRTFLRAFNFELLQVNAVTQVEHFSVIVGQIKSEFSDIFNGDLGAYNLGKVSLATSSSVGVEG